MLVGAEILGVGQKGVLSSHKVYIYHIDADGILLLGFILQGAQYNILVFWIDSWGILFNSYIFFPRGSPISNISLDVLHLFMTLY